MSNKQTMMENIVNTVVWKNNTYTGLSPNHTISKIQGVQ